MTIEETINLIMNNGLGVCCVVFLLYFINGTMKDLISIVNDIKLTLVAIQENLATLSTRVDKIEDKIGSEEI